MERIRNLFSKFYLFKLYNRIRNKHIVATYVKIVPTWKCQLNCDYCSRHFIGENYHHKNEEQILPDQWISILKQLPIDIDVIYITGGGEPFLYPRIAELVEKLIENKYCVKIFSNLQKKIELPVSGRLLISTTVHKSGNKKILKRNIEYYRKKGIALQVYSFGYDYGIKSLNKPLIEHDTDGMDDCLHHAVFNYSPDGKMFINQEDTYFHYKNNGTKKQD